MRATGFQDSDLRQTKGAQEGESVAVQLAVASVTTAVEVNGQTDTESSPLEKATKLSAEQLKGSSNDPDEFRRQLLALAAAKVTK